MTTTAEFSNVGIFAVIAIGFAAVTLALAKIFRAHVKDDRKMTAYECGMPAQGGTEIRTNIRYYNFALLFVLFDVETLFIYPWAVRAKEAGAAGLLAIGIFAGMLFLGLFYAWKKGALEWE
ncbi:MAG: NADH-quinone oxidoreductase subunit A [Elusimicrobia bacterium]|nr:NADH-quinone oxidoreductase subunit A [Elusimicrobiota bacterium]